MGMAGRVFGVAKDGDYGLKCAFFGRLGECINTVFAHKPGTAPSSKAYEVEATLNGV